MVLDVEEGRHCHERLSTAERQDAHDVDDGSSVPVAFSEDDGASTRAAHPRPSRHILYRSPSIVQREDELARWTLVVAVLSGSSDFILTRIAN
jgi:hypothetical protein